MALSANVTVVLRPAGHPAADFRTRATTHALTSYDPGTVEAAHGSVAHLRPTG